MEQQASWQLPLLQVNEPRHRSWCGRRNGERGVAHAPTLQLTSLFASATAGGSCQDHLGPGWAAGQARQACMWSFQLFTQKLKNLSNLSWTTNKTQKTLLATR
jgi:hypothetical protein